MAHPKVKATRAHHWRGRTAHHRADDVRASLGHTKTIVMFPTFHMVAYYIGVPYTFAKNPHLFITSICSCNNNNIIELVFRHVYPSGQSATRELFNNYRMEAHATIRKRLGINIFCTDTHGDTITRMTQRRQSTNKKNGS
jgi:hypothetical protein